MSQDLGARLQTIIARKAARDADLAAARDEMTQRVAAESAKRENAARIWEETCSPMINRTVATLNREIALSGLALNITENERRPTPALAHFTIDLHEDGMLSNKSLLVNVNALGKMQLSASIPQKTTPSSSTDVSELDQEQFREALINFLDWAIEPSVAPH
jgi:hypothetical protein